MIEGKIVCDPAHPARHAKVVVAGAEVSEVKWLDNGARQFVCNRWIIEVQPTKES